MSSDLRSGSLLAGRYRLVRLLGRGGMGTIWEAQNESVERRFAIKLLHPAFARDPVIVQRFLQEARMAGRIQHPGVVAVYDLGREPDPRGGEPTPYLVMELLNGKSLDVWLEGRSPLSIGASLLITLACARALDAAHKTGVIHRDLKCGNVFLQDVEGVVVPKVLDFGISKPVDPGSDAGLTMTGDLVGSPTHMSPEQWTRARDIDARTDIWSLGVVLFQCLTGTLPFEDQSVKALERKVTTTDAPPPRHLVPELPPDVDAIVVRCLRRKRSERFASAVELAAEIERVLDQLGLSRDLASQLNEAQVSLRAEQLSHLKHEVRAQREVPTAPLSEALAREPAVAERAASRRAPVAAAVLVGLLLLSGLALAGLLRRPGAHAESSAATQTAATQTAATESAPPDDVSAAASAWSPPAAAEVPAATAAPVTAELEDVEKAAPGAAPTRPRGASEARERRPRAHVRPVEPAPKPPPASAPLADPLRKPGF